MRLSPLLSIPFVVAVAASLGGCGDGETGTTGGAGACVDYAKFAGMTPTVSFATDVLPTFRNSCALSASCHGVQGGPATQPYLGQPGTTPMTAADIAEIFTANVDVDSVKAPGMLIVKTGDAANSFLMHKVDNSLSCPEVKCEGAACGGAMPLAGSTLPEDKRDAIRRWIIQGAKND